MQIELIETGRQADLQTKCHEIRSAATFSEDGPPRTALEFRGDAWRHDGPSKKGSDGEKND